MSKPIAGNKFVKRGTGIAPATVIPPLVGGKSDMVAAMERRREAKSEDCFLATFAATGSGGSTTVRMARALLKERK
jgi:hypothetical protein